MLQEVPPHTLLNPSFLRTVAPNFDRHLETPGGIGSQRTGGGGGWCVCGGGGGVGGVWISDEAHAESPLVLQTLARPAGTFKLPKM